MRRGDSGYDETGFEGPTIADGEDGAEESEDGGDRDSRSSPWLDDQNLPFAFQHKIRNMFIFINISIMILGVSVGIVNSINASLMTFYGPDGTLARQAASIERQDHFCTPKGLDDLGLPYPSSGGAGPERTRPGETA